MEAAWDSTNRDEVRASVSAVLLFLAVWPIGLIIGDPARKKAIRSKLMIAGRTVF